MKNELNILELSIKDYFTKPMLKLMVYPLIGTIFVLYTTFFIIADIGLGTLENAQLQIQQQQIKIENGQISHSEQNESYTGSSIVDFMLRYTVTSWIVSFLVYTIGLFAIGYISIFISLVIVGLLTPRILAIIHRRYYPEVKVNGYGTVMDGLFELIKTAFVMILIFFALLPFYFIPVINIVAINLPFYYFFHKMLHYDVASTLMSKEQFVQIYYSNKLSMRLKTLFLYIVSLIPFMAMFISIFYIIYLGHSYFRGYNRLISK